ncbi:MAG: efflux RND transporter permease subunit [Alphaproteobacteria bacterium]|nr:efflux RND transporter permease subunit [Alphaproteobacteria bacterium]
MDLIRLALDRPIAVIAAVLMVVMFGFVSLQTIPIQLTPDVRKPVITIRTVWPGAAPAEIEREITNRQEEFLRGIEGLEEMSSRSQNGRATVTLEFGISTNMDRALLLVANRLDQVSEYPEEADEPSLQTSGSEDTPIAWFIIQRAEPSQLPMFDFGDFVEDVVRDRLERVPGVSSVNVFGGSEREMRVTVDPERMSRYGLTVTDIVTELRRANASVSAGDIDEGKRNYTVRQEGDFETPDHVAAVVLRAQRDETTGRVARVTVGDIANVDFDYKDPVAHIRHRGNPSIAVNTVRETGANVIETMAGIREAIAELNEFALPQAGLKIQQVYDETVYIDSAIDLVTNNIYIGGTLAAIVLLLFLRSWGATLTISLAIPVSVIGSFVAMAALGRSINVISLAGIAFAVGMVVDAAIVVLENIFRLREEGKSRREAAYHGAKQVWGAILVSALTTVMVFIPILVMKLEVGQLFRDIAVAISVSVLLSLVVAITLIPALANRLLGDNISDSSTRLRIPILDDLAHGFVEGVMSITRAVVASRPLAYAVVVAICGIAAISTWLLLPKLDYLPEGNRNLTFGVMLPPPGYNLDTMTEIAEGIEGEIRPLWEADSPVAEEKGLPRVDNFFFVAFRGQTFMGASAADPARANELIPLIQQEMFKEPGTFGFVRQLSLFGRGIGGGRTIDFNITGPDLERVIGVALNATEMISSLLPLDQGHQLRPIPGLELGAPEVRIYPDRVRLSEIGVSAAELGSTIDAFNDGLRVAEITVDGKRLDLMLAGPHQRVTETQGISSLPVVTRGGLILPVSSVADVVVTSGPTEIRHLERGRTITLQVAPSPDMPLEAAMNVLRDEVIAPISEQGLPPGVKITLSGTADKLTETWDHMVVDLVLAVLIVYLVMAVLFESFIYPMIILLSVPLATAGGVGGLAIVNFIQFQPLDMLTLLGFVILIGIVVNNAILLVHQTLHHIRHDGMDGKQSILAATQNRIRPIFMSTLTSVFGMLPLVVVPGAGSELYRGLGSVVIGGLALSALLTLLIIPPLLSLVVPIAERQILRHKAPAPYAAE